MFVKKGVIREKNIISFAKISGDGRVGSKSVSAYQKGTYPFPMMDRSQEKDAAGGKNSARHRMHLGDGPVRVPYSQIGKCTISEGRSRDAGRFQYQKTPLIRIRE
jgi:hypothetical protein